MRIKKYRREHTWLAARSKYITSSDIPVILGIGYKDPLHLFYEKRGELVGEDNKDALAVRFAVGHHLENLADSLAQDSLGIRTIDPGRYALATNPDIPWAAVSPDRFIVKQLPKLNAKKILGLLELKTVHDSQKFRWEGGPDRYALTQLLFQLAVCGLDVGAIAAIIGLGEFVAHEIDLLQYQTLQDEIMDAAWAFNKRILRDDPPPVGWSAIPTLKLRFPTQREGTKHFIPPQSGWVSDIRAYRDLKESRSMLKDALKPIEQGMKDIEAKVMMDMEDAERVEGPGFTATWKTQTRKATAESQSRVFRMKVEANNDSE